MLEPLLQVALGFGGEAPSGEVGLLLIGWDGSDPESVSELAEMARLALADRPMVRFADTELAVLVAAGGASAAQSAASDLTSRALAAGTTVWSSYAATMPGRSITELIAEAEAGLAYARRMGPGTFSG
jgi:hypothetical protein